MHNLSQTKAAEGEFITRERLANNVVQKLARERGDGPDMLTDAELLASRRQLIADDWQGEIWVFAYGSLLWNPVIHIAATKRGRIYGYHRQFCLKTMIGRGSPDSPGLVLGLDRGGACAGLAMRVEAKDGAATIAELDLLWRREMLNASYQPRRVMFYPDDGNAKPFACIAFTMNRQHRSYVRGLSHREKTAMIATASGFAGKNRDYLVATHEALQALGIHDSYIESLYQAVSRQG